MKLKNLLWVAIATLFNLVAMAQPTVPPAGGPAAGAPATGAPAGGTTSSPICWDPNGCVPIDTGIIFLLVGGVLLAISFIYRMRSKKTSA